MTPSQLVSRIASAPFRTLGLVAALAVAQAATLAPPARAAEEAPPAKKSKFRPFADVTKDAKKIDGMFDLYHDDQHLYAALKGSDLDRDFLAPMSIARGAASAGMGLNFGDEWVISFKRVGDVVQLIRKNVHYEAPKGTPLEKAVEQNYTDSVLMALPIVADDAPGGAVLIDLADIFFTDFADISYGGIDRQRSSWRQIKGFDKNLELQVNTTFRSAPAGRGSYGDSGYIDPRGVTIVMHYSIVAMPDGGYKPRMADQRVGHFLNATKDFGSQDPDTTFVRRINRWRLEKSDPSADVSPPKKQIVWWIEDNVPLEYRPYVEEGILEWNKAFEKCGIRNALSVRWQNDRDEFDPEDVNYCTFRWITTPQTFAMSNVRSNPITGEMIDGDVIFDASWIRYWQQEHAYLVGAPAGGDKGDDDKDDDSTTLAVGDVISPMMAAQRAYGMPLAIRSHLHGRPTEAVLRGERVLDVIPAALTPFHRALSRHASETGTCAACQCASAMQGQFRLAAAALAGSAVGKEGKDGKLPEELIGQTIKAIVMHEVGHSLGLRHNFRASTMLDADELNDTEITRKKGLVGSVMDYVPINIAAKGQKQGDFATTTIGPYDYWAIEYAYKPISGNEAEELKKIAARSPEAGNDYATDEDLYAGYDPRVNVYDLGSDGLAFAKSRIDLANGVLADLEDNLIKDGDSWARLRPAFLTILQQYGDAAYLAMRYVGGREVSRDARGGDKAKDPIVPISSDKQREALKFVAKTILIDEPIPMQPELLRRVTSEHWLHWGANSSFDPASIGVPFYGYIQSIQNIALSEAFGSAEKLRMIENNEALSAKDDKPLRTAEVFRTFTDAVWGDLKTALRKADKAAASKDADKSDDESADKEDQDGDAKEPQELKLAKVRRNLERLHLKYLLKITLGPQAMSPYAAYAYFSSADSAFPAEARSLARLHVKEIQGLIKETLDSDKVALDEVSRAHLEELSDQIAKALDAKSTAGDF